MGRGVRIAIVMAGVVAILSIGAFLYLTRSIAAPSIAIQDSVTQLDSADTTGSETVYRISQDDSTAEYNIFEVLNGSDKTVVGTTDQIAGDILINLTDPSQSQIGDIRIDARTFATDDTRRDNSVARSADARAAGADCVIRQRAADCHPNRAATGELAAQSALRAADLSAGLYAGGDCLDTPAWRGCSWEFL